MTIVIVDLNVRYLGRRKLDVSIIPGFPLTDPLSSAGWLYWTDRTFLPPLPLPYCLQFGHICRLARWRVSWHTLSMRPEALLGFPALRDHDLKDDLWNIKGSKRPYPANYSIRVQGEIDGKETNWVLEANSTETSLQKLYAGEPIDIYDGDPGYLSKSGLKTELALVPSSFPNSGEPDFDGFIDGKRLRFLNCLVPLQDIPDFVREPLRLDAIDPIIAHYAFKVNVTQFDHLEKVKAPDRLAALIFAGTPFDKRFQRFRIGEIDGIPFRMTEVLVRQPKVEGLFGDKKIEGTISSTPDPKDPECLNIIEYAGFYGNVQFHETYQMIDYNEMR